MPLIDCADSLLTVVDTQPRFFDHGRMSPEERAAAATGRGTAVVVGFETDVCVAQSAVGLRDLGLRAVVVADATYSTGEQHRRGLDRMLHAGVEYNHFKGLVFEWLRDVAYAREVYARAVDRFGAFPV